MSSRQARDFKAGDRVYLAKKRGRNQLSKQDMLYSGPYPVRKKLGNSTYVLGGTPTAVPPLQNIQYLRPYSSSPSNFEDRMQRVADTPADEEEDEWEVEGILDHQGEGAHRRYLVKWKDSEENTWLPKRNLSNCQELLQQYLRKRDIESSDSWNVQSVPQTLNSDQAKEGEDSEAEDPFC